jgi:glucose-1-phosphate cytidylyltransferase
MKTIILAGGLGTRISEETENRPKPMVLIDDKPILWHVMNIYASQGVEDFAIAADYKVEAIDNSVNSFFSVLILAAFDACLVYVNCVGVQPRIENFLQRDAFESIKSNHV